MQFYARHSWLLAGAAVAIISLAAIALLIVLPAMADGRLAPAEADALAAVTPQTSSPPLATDLTDSAEPSIGVAPTPSGEAVVYSSVTQAGGEITGGHEIGEAPIENCIESTVGRDWFGTRPYEQYDEVDRAGDSVLRVGFTSPSGSLDSHSFEGKLAPQGSLSFTYFFDSCRPIVVWARGEDAPVRLLMRNRDLVLDSAGSPVAGVDMTTSETHARAGWALAESGMWTITVENPSDHSQEVEVYVRQVGPLRHMPVAICEATVQGDRLTLDGSQSYDPDGRPVTVEWSRGMAEPVPDGSVIDISGENGTFSKLWKCDVWSAAGDVTTGRIEVWYGNPPADARLPDEVTLRQPPAEVGLQPIACYILIGPDGIDYVMPDHTVTGEPLVAFGWDLPFNQSSTSLTGHLDVPPGVGDNHDAYCFGTDASGREYRAHIRVDW